MSKGLRYTFLVHAIVAFIFGVGLLFVPKQMLDLAKWTPVDTGMARIFAGLMLGVCASSWLAYRATEWGHVRIIVRMENVITALGTLAALYVVLLDNGPAFAWVQVAVFAVFAAAFGYYGRAPQAKAVVSGQTAESV